MSAVSEKIDDVYQSILAQPNALKDEDFAALEKLFAHAMGRWERELLALIAERYHGGEAERIAKQFTGAFSFSFQEVHTPESALDDIAAVERLFETNSSVVISLSKQSEVQQGSEFHLSLYHQGAPLSPSRMLRIVENLGFTPVSDQHFRCEIKTDPQVREVYIHDFPVLLDAGQWDLLLSRAAVFEEMVQAIWEDREGNDRLNELLVFAGLNMREVKLLRAIGRYLMQARLPYSQDYYYEILIRHSQFAGFLINYFHARFDPAQKDPIAEKIFLDKTTHYIADVKSLDDDRVLRRILSVVQAMQRTNFYQTSPLGGYKPQLSFKLLSEKIIDLPKPLPLYETFIYSHRVEGIHLRSSMISRGGIRWSDRREDFRDEVLDLMKAQTVKNSVIVPTGAKGGFYVKRPPKNGDRSAIQAEAIACYQLFIRGLLDITDNNVGGKVIKPQNVVCYDGDDPYLVVAADKGTASFSDIANALSTEYHFWLGDAFASGGSAGYDHKKMGITARGAWESARHHGYQLGINVDADPITVTGVGDMGGDVFGNGLLQSQSVKLIGAFSYSHIFCDPDPDAAIGFAERQRLFEINGNWDQYNASLLSKGGRVFSRADKELNLTPEIRAAFDIDTATVTPAELMRAMLRARADLLWFGGIGTYVKSSAQTDADVRDKANDMLRINGNELRVKIVAEGANLGMTQLGRIEAARAGVALNTDFVDNSAGVNTSDYEVNIKILLNQMVLSGRMTEKQRNDLLHDMTDSVANLVLENNKYQNSCIGTVTHLSNTRVEHIDRLIVELEESSHLNRQQEALPSSAEIKRLKTEEQGLTRPEMCVIMSHTKLLLTQKLTKDPFVQDPMLRPMLDKYFPAEISNRFGGEIDTFQLRPQLTAMLLANRMINQLSPYLPKWLKDRTGLGYVEIARAFCICSELYGFNDLWLSAFNLKGLKVGVWQDLLIELLQHMDRTLPWLLNQTELLRDMRGTVALYRPHFNKLSDHIVTLLPPQRLSYRDAHEKQLVSAGVPLNTAVTHANLRSLAAAPGIAAIAIEMQEDILKVGKVYFQVGERFGFDALREQARQSMGKDYWERQAMSSLIEDFSSHQLRMTQSILQNTNGDMIKWEQKDPQLVTRMDNLMLELRARQRADVTMLTVANRRLRGLVPGRDR